MTGVAATPTPAGRRRVPSRGRARRLLWRTILLAFGGLSAGLLYDYVGTRARLKWAILDAERACLTHVDPSDRVVFDNGSRTAVGLSKQARYTSRGDPFAEYGDANGAIVPTLAVWSTEVPGYLSTYMDTRAALQRWWWLRQMPTGPTGGLFSGSGTSGSSVDARPAVYTHRHAAAAGADRLVIVRATVGSDDGGAVGFEACVIPVTGWLGDFGGGQDVPATVPDAAGSLVDLLLKPLIPADGVRLFAGRPDPSDASRFRIDFEMGGKRGAVEGQLLPDETIRWTVRAR